ncbi:hypothetical protein FRC00_008397, partial [Tulasnella sp. 408]
MNNPQFEPKLIAIPAIPKEFGDDGGHFYRYYDALADELDEDMVKSLKSQLDGILIFAGLFAGVNSAFLALTLPEMSADPVDDTNALLLQLITGGNGTIRSSEDLPSASFAPSPGIFPVNVLFSFSLTLALICSFLAVLGQQWLVYYRKRSGGGLEHQRWEQLRRYLGAKRWRLEAILDDILPGLLQFALVIFCVGFVAYLRTLSKTMCYVIAGPMAVAGAILLIVGIAGAWDQWCPFKSPLSHLLQFIGHTIMKYETLHYLFKPVSGTIYILTFSLLSITVVATRFSRNTRQFLTILLDNKSHHDRVYIPLWEGVWSIITQKIDRILDRSGEATPYLQVVAAKRMLCTSEDFNTLIYTAINLHRVASSQTTRWLLSDDDVWDRLKELCTGSQDLLAEAASGAFVHLVWVGESAELLLAPPYRPSFIAGSEEPPRDEIFSTFNSLVANISTHSKNIGRGVKLPLTDWSDSVELLFYCKLLTAALNQPRYGCLRTSDSVVREFSALQRCPLRLIGLVAYATYIENELRSTVDPDLMPDAIIPWAIEGTAAWHRAWAEKRRLEMGMVDMLVNKGSWNIEFEPAKGVSSVDDSRDNVLELIKRAFEKKPARLRDADGIT